VDHQGLDEQKTQGMLSVCTCGGGGEHVKSFFYSPSVRVEWNLNFDSRIFPFAKGVMKKKN